MTMSHLATMLPLQKAMASVAKHVDFAAGDSEEAGYPKRNDLFDVARRILAEDPQYQLSKASIEVGDAVMRLMRCSTVSVTSMLIIPLCWISSFARNYLAWLLVVRS